VNRIIDERPTSNIELPMSNYGTLSAFQFHLKNGAKRNLSSTFEVERSMFDVHLVSVKDTHAFS
jgi:hypothetical protein